MADEKLNTGPAENISPEAAEPITTPEQAAASEPQQEQIGPAIPESGDVVVSFDKINELMAEKRQNARAEVEKAETPEAPVLLWQIAYSEIYITDTLWPDFNEEELDKAIEVFNKRDRRFGGVK